jgi:hypothetical protein
VTQNFAITFDYLCPFARNANEHVVEGLRAGADWDVTFTPYSLAQGHTEEGEPAVWDRDEPDRESGLLALQVGLAVRDHHRERFADAHVELFAARHDRGEDLKDPQVLRSALRRAGVDPEPVFEAVASGGPLKTLRTEHEAAVADHEVWGVPTFITASRAVFVRLLDRPEGDGALARQRIDHVIALVDSPLAVHEFKQTDLPF